jgi:MFS family permease
VPTISITNQIAFAHLKDSKDFGVVRAGGTIGWILAAWPFFFIFSGLTGPEVQAATKYTYIVAGAAGLLLAGLSLILPHTPPKHAGEAGAQKLAWAEAFKLLRHPYVLVLWLVTFVDSFVHNIYFAWAGVFFGTPAESGGVGIAGKWIMPLMSIGQVAEILTMFVLGATLKRLGYRMTMVLGILAYPIRFGVWAFFPHNEALIIIVQALHGVCYAFFFVSVYIFAEEYFPKDVRSSAQGLFNFMILGLGALVGYALGPKLRLETFAKNGVTDFQHMFFVPLLVALVSASLLILFFWPPKKKVPTPETPMAA